jgi:hypothetical protein
MTDKKVVMCDFRGIKPGMLVKFDKNKVGLVLERLTYALMLGDGDGEAYDPMLVVLSGTKREVICVDDVNQVLEEERI